MCIMTFIFEVLFDMGAFDMQIQQITLLIHNDSNCSFFTQIRVFYFDLLFKYVLELVLMKDKEISHKGGSFTTRV